MTSFWIPVSVKHSNLRKTPSPTAVDRISDNTNFLH